MPSYTAYKRQVMDADDNITWITMNGNHIPIKEGQTKEEAVKEFLASKGKSGEGSAKHGSGEYKAKSEHLGGRINTNIDPNREKAGKTKYDPSDDFATQLYKHKKDTQSKGEGSAPAKSEKKDPWTPKTKENYKNEIINGQTHFTYTDPDGLNFRVWESSNDPGWKATNRETELFNTKEEAINAAKATLKEDKLKYGDFTNKRNKDFLYKRYKKDFPESEPEMGDPNEAQRLSGIEKPKTEKHKDLRSAFGKHYDKLYNDRDLDDKSGYLLDEWDKHIQDPKFKKAVQEFVQERGDFISSDREVKAFMLAAKETGLIPQEKKAKAKSKSDSPLVKAVAKALGKSESEAESEIDGAAQYIKDLMKSNDLRNGDVEETLRGLGVEPDYAEEFMQWASAPKKKASKKTKEPAIVRQGGVNYVDPKAWNSPASDPWYSLYE